jgi:cytochrome c oxidase subunit 1
MTIGALMFFVVLVGTAFFGRRGEGPTDIPFSEVLLPGSVDGWDVRLDRLGWWVVAAVVLILLAYGPFFIGYLPPHLVSPGYSFF